jgi:hypothetical protein
VSVLALVIQHATRMRRIIFSSVAALAVEEFFTLSPKGHDFRKRKKLLQVKHVFLFSLQLLSETFLIRTRIQQDVIINVLRSSCKVSVIFVR